jgi:hypothetical protein
MQVTSTLICSRVRRAMTGTQTFIVLLQGAWIRRRLPLVITTINTDGLN